MKFRRPKGSEPTPVWIGEEKYDSTMEGRHQKIFDCMGIKAKHHPWVPVDYCEPDYVTKEWDGGEELYIESKDLGFHKNLPNSLRFGREKQKYVYYMGKIRPPKNMADLIGQVIAKGFGPADRGFNPFSLYYCGLKDIKCCIAMVTVDGHLHLVRLEKDTLDDVNGFIQELSDAGIDIDKTLSAVKFGAGFTDWDAIQRPGDAEPIFKMEGNKIMNSTIINSDGQGTFLEPVKGKRTRKQVEAPTSPTGDNLTRAAEDAALRAIGLDPQRIRCEKTKDEVYRMVGGNTQMYQAVFKPFIKNNGKIDYSLMVHNVVIGAAEFLVANWGHVDCTWYISRIRCEIYSGKKPLAQRLKGKNKDERIVIFTERYNARIRETSGVVPLPYPETPEEKRPTKRATGKNKQNEEAKCEEDLSAVLVPVCPEFARRMDKWAREKHESKAEISRKLINAIDKMGYFI